ncbi:TetR/AcrR family transcriptional regulator [Streptacidiphilus sp. PAMC 29251]
MTDPEPLTRAEQARQTRQRILDTAGRLFSERSYEGTTLQQIADEMGVTKAAVYYYFPTKAEILTAIVVPEFQAMDDLLDVAETKRSRAERIRVVVAGLVDMLVAQREALSILHANPSIKVVPGTDTASFEAMRERAVTVLYGDDPTPDQRAALYITVGVAAAVPSLADLPTEVLRETLTRACTRLFKTG